jgi:hypothetical protein
VTFAQVVGLAKPWRVCWLVCVSWFVIVATRAQEAGPSAALTLTPGATCLTQRALEQSLEQALDRRLESTGLRVQVQGSTHDPRTAVIRLFSTRAPEGASRPAIEPSAAPNNHQVTPLAERSFSPGPPRCVDFQHAVALAITMMINNAEREQPLRVEQTVPSDLTARSLPVVTPPPARVPQRSQREPAVVPERPRASPLQIEPLPQSPRQAPSTSGARVHGASPRSSYWRAQAELALGRHVGPPRTQGLSAGLAYARSRLEGQLGLLSLFSTQTILRDTALHYRTRPLAARVALAYPLWSKASVSLRLAVSALAGRMRTELDAPGLQSPRRVRWFAGGVSLELSVPLGASLGLALSAGLVGSVRQLGVKAEVDGELVGRQVFRPVGALFGLGLAAQRSFGDFGQGSTAGRHP